MFTSRRDVLKMAGTAIITAPLSINLISSARANALINGDTLKVGLVGCGGRGTGAAKQALKADPNVVLHAVGDIFKDKMDASLAALRTVHGDKIVVDEEHKFLGFDAFQKVIDSGVDVVLLCTPPHFRPDQMTAAVNAGKHVFCEKPVAVDAPGVRKVLAAAKAAKEKNLSVVAGFCFRYDNSKRECFSRVIDGQIGEINTVYNSRFAGTLWSFPRQPQWTDAEYQLRNWMYYSWLSGDYIVEQAVHSIDMMSWAMGGKLPVAATGTGGRQVRTEPIFGNVYDHFAITYDYENGAKGIHFSRQQTNCFGNNVVEVLGTKGRAMLNASRSTNEIIGKKSWKFEGPNNDMFQTEHDELFASIRKGKAINNGEYMAHSTLLAIMGRMAAYTGKRITWEEAMNSREKLGPDTYSFNMSVPKVEIAMPGITSFI
jgi:myo-inositol 2-dehydrogenase/D-chiro-inositol 1-dehydrogenase